MAIIANIAILFIWLRIVAMILPIFKYKKYIILASLAGAVIGATTLRITPQIIHNPFNSSMRTAQGVVRGIITILSIITLLSSPSQRKNLLQTTIIIAIVSSIGHTLAFLSDNPPVVHFFLSIITIEERIKYTIAQHNHSKWSIYPKDIIIFGILAALGYARWENILTTTGVGSAIARSTTYIMHALFTILLLSNRTNTCTKGLLRMSVSLSLGAHLRYNLSNGQMKRAARLLVITTGYIIISYTLSQIDSIYITKRVPLAKTPINN